MHKLVRTEEPSVLTVAADSYSTWDDFPSQEKTDVALSLCAMQSERCAYCEAKLGVGNGHIEHFRRKAPDWFPDLTFSWPNLFYSCMRNGTCGLHKDRVLAREDVDDLINPCEDNPEDFLQFTHDGRVAVRSGLCDRDRKRADLTIKTFNLNQETLVAERKNELKKYEWLGQYSTEEIDACLENLGDVQFITAIFHFFGRKYVRSGTAL